METTGNSIKFWAEDDRPREKLKNKGRSVLSNAEILAILLGSGSRDKSALDLAREIMASTNNNLDALGKFSIKDFTKFKGIGEAKAITLIAALELGRRRKDADTKTLSKITCSHDAFQILLPYYSDLEHEEFHILLLNRANKVIDKIHISSGGVSGTVVDIRMMVKPAVMSLASGVILSHNHPSGNLKPSAADERLTKKAKEALAVFDIAMLDHLIITNSAYYSFADEGIL